MQELKTQDRLLEIKTNMQNIDSNHYFTIDAAIKTANISERIIFCNERYALNATIRTLKANVIECNLTKKQNITEMRLLKNCQFKLRMVIDFTSHLAVTCYTDTTKDHESRDIPLTYGPT